MILVTGASGMVGSHLADVFSEGELHQTDVIRSAHVEHLDCRDRDQVVTSIGRLRPDIVLHMAAETDVDRCEREPDHAFRSNALATLNIALACRQYDVTLVYVSTAGMFDGRKPEPYTEFDSPNPVNVYAQSKLEGEKFVQAFVPRYYIVRAGWMFGGKGKDKKFVGKIASLCMEGADIKAVDDKFGCPTYAVDLLRAIKILMRCGLYGVYHIVNSGSCSRYEVAVEICRLIGRSARIVPVCSANFPLSAPRPRSEVSRAYKFELLGLGRMRPWHEALADYLEAWSTESADTTQSVVATSVGTWNGIERRRYHSNGNGASTDSSWKGLERRGIPGGGLITPSIAAVPPA